MDIQTYQLWRDNLAVLQSDVVNKLPDSIISESARMLGLLRDPTTIVVDGVEQSDTLKDLALYESVRGDHSGLDLYRASHSPKSDMEEALLDAMVNSRSSFFEILEVHPDERLLVYQDLLDPSMGQVLLTDIHFSQTARTGTLIFTRVIPVPGGNMSSGVSFLFDGGLKKYLLRRHKAVMKKIPSENVDVQRYAAFFKLFRSEGLPVAFRTV